MIRRFWLQVDHATELAHRSLEQTGWELTGSSDWQLAWTLDLPSAGTFAEAAGGRWLNHLRGISALTVKSYLCHTLRGGAQRAAAAGADSLFAFAPQTFVLPGEWNEWMRARAWDPDAVWIQKPADSSRGRGVALVTSLDDVRGNNLVVQRYIDRPHLLDGFKYSLRFYVLIVSLDPLVAYLFDDGFTKLASRPFSLDAASRGDRFRHLTNPDVLRDDPEAEGVSTRNSTHRQYRERLRHAGVDDAALFARIRRVLAATLVAAQPAMRAHEHEAGGTGRGQFELLGVDVAIDDRLQPWLLECNLAPSLSVEASAATDASRDEAALKTRVVADTLRLVGADTGDAAPVVPTTADEARTRLAWHDSRRGCFERLWPSPESLDALAGSVDLGMMDLALLADEAANGGWRVRAAGNVHTVTVDEDIVLLESGRDRLALLDAGERDAWMALTRSATTATADAWLHGIDWLAQGLLTSDAGEPQMTSVEASPTAARRTRIGWNLEQVYALHGLHVAVRPATPRQAAALDHALAWWAAPGEREVDASLYVPPRAAATDTIARIHKLALRRLGGIVRRVLTFARKGDDLVLVVGGEDPARRFAGDGWIIESRPTVIGGRPFGVWNGIDETLTPAGITAMAGSGSTRGELLLDLVTAGPGAVTAFDAAGVRALAAWIETIPLWPTANPET